MGTSELGCWRGDLLAVDVSEGTRGRDSFLGVDSSGGGGGGGWGDAFVAVADDVSETGCS